MDETHFAIGTIVFTLVIILVSFAACIIPIVLVFKYIGKMSAKNAAIMNNGVPAQARVVQMGPTGMTINDAPQMNIVLEIHPAQGNPAAYRGFAGPTAPFTATIQCLVPVYAMGRIQPGAMVPVKYDPVNPMSAAIDFRAMGFM